GDGLLAIHQIIPPSTKAAALPASTAQWLKTLTPAAFAKTWRERAQRCRLAEETPLVMTPTALSARASERESERREVKDSHGRSLPRSLAPLLGTLVHRFLEQWDFSCEKCSMPAKLRVVANHYFASQGLLKEPFPDPKDGDKTNNPRELVELVE